MVIESHENLFGLRTYLLLKKLEEMKTKINKMTLTKLKTSIRLNWESPFIIGFMMLMSAAAVFLAIGLALLAEVLAALSYFSLTVSVIIRFARLLKKEKE